MHVLLDECVPRALGQELVGHEVSTVTQLGRAGMRNGALMEAAGNKFDALITIDKLLDRPRDDVSRLVVITLKARTNRLTSLRPLVPEILRAFATAQPGTRVGVGT